jgi:hypothetical protein
MAAKATPCMPLPRRLDVPVSMNVIMPSLSLEHLLLWRIIRYPRYSVKQNTLCRRSIGLLIGKTRKQLKKARLATCSRHLASEEGDEKFGTELH